MRAPSRCLNWTLLTFLPLIALVWALAFPASDLYSQTWSGLGGDGLWSNPANWVGGVAPVSSTSTAILFDHNLPAQYVSNQDVGSPFVANSISVRDAIGSSSSTFAIVGGAIAIDGAGSKLDAFVGGPFGGGLSSELIFHVDVAVRSETDVTGSMSFRRSLEINNNLTNQGVMVVVVAPGQFSAGSVAINNATVQSSNGSVFNVVRGSIVGNGSMVVNNSDLHITESDLNVPVLFNGSGRLVAGTSERDSTVTSDITFTGPSSRLDIFQFNGKVVNFDGTIRVPSGSLTINNTGNGNGIITGSGRLEVDSSANVRTASNVFVELDSVVSGALSVNGRLVGDVTTATGSVLSGTGLIDGLVNLSGKIAPGNSAGTIGIDGTIDIDLNATVSIELGGTAAGINGYDSINGFGGSRAFLDGDLELIQLGSFIPSFNDTFDILSDFAVIDGTFKNTAGGRVAYKDGWFDVTYGSSFVRLSNFTLTAVPEPSSCILVCLTLPLALHRRRKLARQSKRLFSC